MSAKIKEFVQKYGTFLAFVVLGFALGFCFSHFVLRGSATTGNSNDVDTTIQQITGDQQQAVSEIDAAIDASRSAQDSISAAGERIGDSRDRVSRSTEIAKQSTVRLDDIAKGISECRELAQESKRILDAVGETNRVGESTSKTN